MSLKVSRVATLTGALVAVAAISLAATSAFAAPVIVHLPFKNWVAAGTVTPKKLNEPITLPEGSTFNGEAAINLVGPKGEPSFSGTVKGTLFVPPFNAQMKILGIPETVGLKLAQASLAEGTVTVAPKGACGEVSGNGSYCVTLTVPTKVNMEITTVGAGPEVELGLLSAGLGVSTTTACATTEPITFNLVRTLTVKELLSPGPHFTGTTTFPPIQCTGLEGPALTPVLTALISGPENPYALGIGP
jgi:hypothetical protein